MTLSTLYDMSSNKFFIELRKFRARLKAFKMKFKNFASLAEYILKTLNDTEYPILRKLTRLFIDCKRAFSAMNRIKSPERSKLKSILKTLMLAYTAQDHEKENLDIEKFSRDISTDLRKKDGKKSYFENDFIV